MTSDKFNMRLDGVDAFRARLKQLRMLILKDLRDILNRNSLWLITHLRTSRLVDKTTSTTLASRSMQLKRSLRAIAAKIIGESVQSGVSIGTPYAKVHFGPKGSEFMIRPKNRQYLTIPLKAAKDRRGLARAGATDPIWGSTFIRKTRSGAKIIFQRKGNKIQPLFLLSRGVMIKRRIAPSQLFGKVKVQILQDLSKARAKWQLA